MGRANCAGSDASRGCAGGSVVATGDGVATVSEAAGVGHVLATDTVVVDTDTQGVGVQWSDTSNSDDFAKNLIRARCEGWFGTTVLSPLRVVSCDLTA